MSLCGLMQMDFKYGTGRYDEKTGAELYSDYDLRYGIEYAEGWMSDGETRDLIGQFDLAEFAAWCKEQLQMVAQAKPGRVYFYWNQLYWSCTPHTLADIKRRVARWGVVPNIHAYPDVRPLKRYNGHVEVTSLWQIPMKEGVDNSS